MGTALPEMISWSPPNLSRSGYGQEPCQATSASLESLQEDNKETVHVCILQFLEAAPQLPLLLFTALKVKVRPEKDMWESGVRRCREGAQDLPLASHRSPPAVSSQQLQPAAKLPFTNIQPEHVRTPLRAAEPQSEHLAL